jgi:replicative DNA helicase
MGNSSGKEAVLLLAAQGIPVFPVGINKKPFTENGFKDATTETAKILDWFDEFPDCNWAIATGHRSGIAVLDIDPRNGGDVSLRYMLDQYTKGQKLPTTPVVKTGGGGFHYYFKQPLTEVMRNRTIKPGVDVKTEGGYIIVPPSVTDAEYKWIRSLDEVPLAEMPGWIVEMASKGAQNFEFDEGGKVAPGQRNNYLTSLAGTMRRRGFLPQAIQAALEQENELRCNPPVDDYEIEHIVESVSRYEPEDPALKEHDDDLDLDVRMEAIKSEQIILGYILGNYDPTNVNSGFAIQSLDHSQFIDHPHRRIFKAIKALFFQSVKIDIENLQTELERMGDWGKEKIDETYIHTLIKRGSRIVYPADVRFHVNRIVEAYVLREASFIFSQGAEASKSGAEDPMSLISLVNGRLMKLLDSGSEKQIFHTKEATEKVRKLIADAKKGILNLNEPTGWKSIDEMIVGLPKGELSILAARPSQGKLLCNEEPVLTPNGWVRNGDLRPGDFVFGPDGKPSEVLKIFPHKDYQIVTVEFNDGTKIRSSWDHLWETSNRAERKRGTSSVKTTREIADTLTEKGGRRSNHHIPNVEPIQFPERNLLIDPYVLGVWLGNGHTDGGRITNADAFVWDEIVRRGYELGPNTEGKNSGCETKTIYGLQNKLRELDLLGNKHVPDIYLISSVEQRLDLLRGLMDTDGHYAPSANQTTFSTTTPALRDAVVELVLSLGGRATYGNARNKKYVHNGKTGFGKDSWQVTVSFPNDTNPFLLPRKAKAFRPVKRFTTRKIIKVYEDGKADATCILVDNPRHLYVARNYVLTHNTAFALELATQMSRRWYSKKERGQVVIFSAEMTDLQLMTRNASREAEVDGVAIRTGQISAEEEERLNAALDMLDRETDIWIDQTSAPTGQYMLAKCLALHKPDNPVRLVIMDFLELVGEEPGSRSRDLNKVLRLEEALRKLKELAKQLNCVVIVLSQLSREVESRATINNPPIPRQSDLRWTGMAEQIANMIFMLYYPWHFWNGGIPFEEEPAFDHYEIHIPKNRDGKVGVVVMRFIKQFGKFIDLELEATEYDDPSPTASFHPSLSPEEEDLPWI